MYCPFCSFEETKVLESRLLDASMRRRRECLQCSNRFTTYERAEFHFSVLKKDGREEPFNLEKIKNSILKACHKPQEDQIQALAHRIEQKILLKKANPIKTKDIGRYVLQELKKFDKLAYFRYATVHKSIEDPRLLEKELHTLA